MLDPVVKRSSIIEYWLAADTIRDWSETHVRFRQTSNVKIDRIPSVLYKSCTIQPKIN